MLSRMTLGQQLLAIMLIPLLGLTGFAAIDIQARFQRADEMSELLSLTRLATQSRAAGGAPQGRVPRDRAVQR